MHPVGPGQGTDTHPLVAGIPADTLKQLHPRHPFSLAPLAW
jgi:hypothetical protein